MGERDTNRPEDQKKSLEEVLKEFRDADRAEVAKNFPALEGDHPDPYADSKSAAKPAIDYINENRIK